MDLGRDQRLRSIETLDDFIYIYIYVRAHVYLTPAMIAIFFAADTKRIRDRCPCISNPPLVNCFPSKKIYLPLPSRIGRIRVGTGAKLVHELRRDD